MLRQTQLQGDKTETIFNDQSDGKTHSDARNPKHAEQTRTCFFEPRNSTILQGHTQDIEKHVLLSAMYPACWEFCFHFLSFLFFDADHFFKVFIEFVTKLFLFYVLAFWPWDTWALSSPTRDQTHTPALEGEVLTTGEPGTSLGAFKATGEELHWLPNGFTIFFWEVTIDCIIVHRRYEFDPHFQDTSSFS